MNEPLDPNPANTLAMPVKATSSWFDAFTSLFNLLMISMLTLFIVRSSIRLLQSDLNVITLCFILLGLLLLGLYLWTILTRSLEINETGIAFREAARQVSLDWIEIDAVKIEPARGQITFWVDHKPIRLHTFGLNRQAQQAVYEALAAQASTRQIQIR